MSLADVSGSELSGPSSGLIRSFVKLADLSGVPHSGILPRLVLRTVSWRASIGRVTNPKGPLSFKAFARGDISSLSPFRLASFSTLNGIDALVVWSGLDEDQEEQRGQGAQFETPSMLWASFPSSTSR
ncbi:hypothetical protein WJX82_008504 [Trebouxia sp. C0006]